MSTPRRALFGGLLWGDAAMRFIHVDEAGTSEHEPVTVVVGLIVDADKQLMIAEAAIEELLLSVPKEFRENFVFHATDIWSDPKYREIWAMTDRLGLMKRMMSLPRRLGIPVTVATIKRIAGRAGVKDSITASQYHHFQAFANCMAGADKYIRDHAGITEIGTVVAENVPEMRKFLKGAVRVWRDNPTILPPKTLNPTAEEVMLGYVKQEGELRVSRIRPNIHFVEKGDEPVTQMADACAFAFRRFFAEESFGQDFMEAVFGGPQQIHLADYTQISSVDTFRWHP